MYYIYGHFLDNKCIYIGSNCMGMSKTRAYDFSDRNDDYKKVTTGRKDEIEVRILKEFKDVKYTHGLNGYIQSEEVKMIARYHDIGEALCSHQDLRGRHHSEETKIKMSHKAIGRKFTEKHKYNISKNHADVRGENNPMYGKASWNRGKHLSEEHKRKISDANKLRCKLEHNNFILELYYQDLCKYCRDNYGIGSGTFKKLLNTQQPYNPRCKRHEKARGLILRRL